MAQYSNVTKKSSELLVICSAVCLFVFFFCGLLAPWIAPYDIEQMDLGARLLMPFTSLTHIFGTDELGRDVFSRLVYSLRLSFLLAIAGTILGAIIGTALGFLAARFGGLVDDVLNAAVDDFGLLRHKRHRNRCDHGCLRLGPLCTVNKKFSPLGLHRRLCQCSGRFRNSDLAHCDQTHSPQHCLGVGRQHDAQLPRHDPLGNISVVFRCRCSAADELLRNHVGFRS